MGPSYTSDDMPTSTYIVAAVLGLSFVGCLIYLLSLIWRVLASILPVSKLQHKPAPAASSSSGPVRSTRQAETQATPQAPGVSMKTLLKQAKAGQGRAAAQDKATHHPLYLNTLKGHGGNVSGLDVSLDGGAIATAADDRTVRVYRFEDATSKNNNFKHKVINAEPVDVAFVADSNHVAVLSKGGLDAANVSMLGPNPSSGGPLQTLWEVPNCHGSQAAIVLHSSLRCGGPHGLLMTCSEKSDMRLFSLSGKLLAVVEPSGLQNHMASLSLDARFFAAATFTSDVKVHEAKFDKHGAFQGTAKVMDLKGHKSQVLVMAFSPDSKRAMTASKDGTYKLWSLDVRYQLNEDAKCLCTRDQQAPKGSLWKHLVMLDNDNFAAGWDSTVQFINASTGQVQATIEQAHEGPIRYMQFATSKMKAGDESVHVLLTAAQKQMPGGAEVVGKTMGAEDHVVDVAMPLDSQEEDEMSDIQTGMRVTFNELVYTVKSAQDRKQSLSILKHVSGFFSAGQMAAIMGPSGSGKSTLLDIISSRKTMGKITGQVLFGSQKATQPFLRRYAGYVEQADTLLPVLTVREMLLYTFELKNKKVEPQTKKAKVDDLISKLALQSCQNTVIGSPLQRGVSGGELKRTNVGIALVTSPRVLFLDEPTSGLDSFTASEVMLVVKGLITENITIAATIHSPTPKTFALFDRILILQRGRVVYFGPNGSSALEYFQGSPHFQVRPRGANESPAEWIVDVTTIADREGRSSEFADGYDHSDLKQSNQRQLEKFLQTDGRAISKRTLQQLQTKRSTTTGFFRAMWILFKYRGRADFTDPAFLGPRLGEKILTSFLIFTIYWKAGRGLNEGNIPNIAGLLFLWITLPAYASSAYVPVLVMERAVFVRELSDGLYRPITYLCFKTAEELILSTVGSVCFSLVVFYCCQMQGSFFPFWLVYLVTNIVGIVLAFFVASISPNMDTANAALPGIVTVYLFFTGYVIQWSSIPQYWRWLGWTDFLRYGWGSLMINQFGGERDVLFFGTPVLKYYSLQQYNTWEFLAYEFLFFLGMFVATWAVLAFKKHVNR